MSDVSREKTRLRYVERSENDPTRPSTTWPVLEPLSSSWWCWSLSLTRFMRELLLPHGYPRSVSDDYLSYQFWDSVQALACYVSLSLSTHSVLKGVGVGDETATPLAAAMSWMMRNGASTLGNIAFSYFKSIEMEHKCKKYRLLADILNDLTICIELISPLTPRPVFHLLLMMGGVARSVVGVAGGATRTAVTQHQARNNNISDVAVKDGSQETLVNLLALIINLCILPLVVEKELWIWSIFLALVLVHLYANYRAVKSLQFESINKERLLILLKHYFRENEVMSIAKVNFKESVWLGLGEDEKRVFGKTIRMGVSFGTLENMTSEHEMTRLKHILEQYGYAIITKDEQQLVLLTQKNAGSPGSIMLEAYLHACFHARLACSEKMEPDLLRTSGAQAMVFIELLRKSSWRSDIFFVEDEGFRGKIVSEDKKSL